MFLCLLREMSLEKDNFASVGEGHRAVALEVKMFG